VLSPACSTAYADARGYTIGASVRAFWGSIT
jgi:hypothetical protein